MLTVLEILVAVFAVFGFYAAVRLILALFLAPRNIGVALEVLSAQDAENIDYLLLCAEENFGLAGRRKLVALVHISLAEDVRLREKLQDANAAIHYIF